MCIRESIMTRMQLVRSGSLKKFHGITSIVRNASFSRGWLHLAVQSLFAVITVTSFILIIMMVIPRHPEVQLVPDKDYRCWSKNCIVFCEQVPYYDQYEEDIVITVSRLPTFCTGFFLDLHMPMFLNETLQSNWLPRVRVPLHELSITSGNLMHLTQEAFLSQYAANIRTLALHNLVIKSWTTDSLVGLSHLEEIYIRNCSISNAQPQILRSVHDTLKILTIVSSDQWDPTNITGTTNLPYLTTVDFSHNVFNDVLDRNSFSGLQNCEILYLNSCNISAIGEGTFDHFRNIEALFLNNNRLVQIPAGLFSNIIALSNPKPRINLHDNYWHCDCKAGDIRQLIKNDMLLTDPICESPKHFIGKTFFELESYCNISDVFIEQTTVQSVPAKEKPDDFSGFVYLNNGCVHGNRSSNKETLKVYSPLRDFQCRPRNIRIRDLYSHSSTRSKEPIISINSWIHFTFFLNTDKYSMIQIGATEANHYGILWYQSTCPNEVYCVNIVPSALRVYNIDMKAKYLFCPIHLNSGSVAAEKCVEYDLSNMVSIDVKSKIQFLFYVTTGGICLVVGAACVYALIRKNPNLLKGSKRILFVKHKTVDALVLPPKVPLRNGLVNELTSDGNDDKIFIVPTNLLESGNFARNKSTRSSKSNAPSYISALQPTDVQLAEWRIRNHFTNDLTSELSLYSWICNTDTNEYTDVIDNDKTYESLK